MSATTRCRVCGDELEDLDLERDELSDVCGGCLAYAAVTAEADRFQEMVVRVEVLEQMAAQLQARLEALEGRP